MLVAARALARHIEDDHASDLEDKAEVHAWRVRAVTGPRNPCVVPGPELVPGLVPEIEDNSAVVGAVAVTGLSDLERVRWCRLLARVAGVAEDDRRPSRALGVVVIQFARIDGREG